MTKDKLDAGDYTIVGHDRPSDDDSIIIERKKTCSELIGNLGTHWERFTREAELLTEYKHKCIIVCCPDNFETLYHQGLTALSPNYIYSRIALLYLKYQIPTIFMPSTDAAENYIFRLFHKIIQRHSQ